MARDRIRLLRDGVPQASDRRRAVPGAEALLKSKRNLNAGNACKQQQVAAGEWLTHAYSVTTIALPGLADHRVVFGHQDAEDVRAFLDHLCVGEIALKAEGAGIFGYQDDQEPAHQAFTAEPNATDTTGAGDSFAGTYLAERLAGVSMLQAMQSAAKVASLVVQHPGAIVDERIYREFMHQ